MRTRVVVAALTVSAAAFVSLMQSEGYTDKAIIPIEGDVPTIGFGSTEGVRLGDTTTPPKALERALRDVNKFEGAVKDCVKVNLHQHEYDFAVHWSYNIGAKAFCESTLVKLWNEGKYAEGCETVRWWYRAAGKDCRIRENNCYGLILRREKERKQCLGLA